MCVCVCVCAGIQTEDLSVVKHHEARIFDKARTAHFVFSLD